jgi:hypothetical protein
MKFLHQIERVGFLEFAEGVVSHIARVQPDCVAVSSGVAIAIGTDNPTLTIMIQDLLGKYVDWSCNHPPCFVLRTVVDPDLANAISETFEGVEGANKNDAVEVTQDVDVVCHRSIDTGHACLWHIVVKSRRLIYSVMADVTTQNSYEMFRVVRLLFHIAFVEAGLVPIHSAVVSRAGRGVCLMGDKYAGKTTLAIQCLEHLRWNLVANDKAFLGVTRNQATVTALPVRAGIRPGTLRSINALSALGEPGVELPQSASQDHRRLYARPEELAKLFGVSVERSVKIDAFIHLARRPEYHGVELQQLDEVTSRSLLELQHTPDDAFDEHPYWKRLMKRDGGPASVDASLNVLVRAARCVPSFRLHYSGGDDKVFSLLSGLLFK